MSPKEDPAPRNALGVTVLVVCALWLAWRSHSESDAPASLTPPPPQASGQLNLKPDAPRVVAQNETQAPLPRSPLGDVLNAPGRTARDDVDQVLKIFQNYLSWLKEMPTGTNREITAKLSGRNSRQLAPLAPDCRAISGDGELVDRWGRPYRFHNLDRNTVEVRSNGPDGVPYTQDDVVAQNGRGPDFLQKQAR